MIIDLKNISQTPREFEYTFQPEWWQCDMENDQVIGLSSPLRIRLKIYRAESKFVLEGILEGEIQLRCDRCLDSFLYNLKTDFSLLLTQPPSDKDQTELELEDEDMSVDFLNGNQIDLDAIVSEQVYLSLPMKTLCHEDCKGLCPECGCNLNTNRCDCSEGRGHPGFSKLKNLEFE